MAVVATAASEGAGTRALPAGARYYERPAHRCVADRPVTVYCPHGRTAATRRRSFPAGTTLHRAWPDVVRWVESRVGSEPTVTVLHRGSSRFGGHRSS